MFLEPPVEIHRESDLETPGVVIRLELYQLEEPNVVGSEHCRAAESRTVSGR